MSKRVLGLHDAGVWTVGLSGDGSIAVSGADDSTVNVWNTTSGLGSCRLKTDITD